MVRELRLRADVLPGGRIEVMDTELPVGQTVEVVVRQESKVEGRSILEIPNSGPEGTTFRQPNLRDRPLGGSDVVPHTPTPAIKGPRVRNRSGSSQSRALCGTLRIAN